MRLDTPCVYRKWFHTGSFIKHCTSLFKCGTSCYMEYETICCNFMIYRYWFQILIYPCCQHLPICQLLSTSTYLSVAVNTYLFNYLLRKNKLARCLQIKTVFDVHSLMSCFWSSLFNAQQSTIYVYDLDKGNKDRW